MKHIFKIIAILVAISAIWVALLETSTVPRSYTWLVSVIDSHINSLKNIVHDDF
jgi:hypothetical protein